MGSQKLIRLSSHFLFWLFDGLAFGSTGAWLGASQEYIYKPNLKCKPTFLMSSDENTSVAGTVGRKRHGALQLGPKKKPCRTDPLVHHGRHFGRAIHALCTVSALLTNGILRMGELAEQPEDTFTHEERREHRIFQQLLQTVPGLEGRLMDSSEEDIGHIAELIQKGANSARSDNMKSLKSAILDWITPRGQPLSPPIAHNIKTDRGFHHERTGALLCPAGLD